METDEDSRVVNEEKNVLRAKAIRNNSRATRAMKTAYKQARSRQRALFRRKKWQLEEEASIEVE